MKKLIKVDGMSCKHCVMHVTEALKGVPGVKDVVVSLEEGTATVDVDAGVSDDVLKAAVTEVGYTPSTVRIL
jgi:copper chaperone CopZ